MDATVLGQLKIQIRGGNLEHKESGKTLVIDENRKIIGRDKGCDLRIDGDRSVSKAHLEMAATERGTLVRDIGSSNGTWIDKIRVTEVYLVDPQQLRIGEKTTLEFTPGPKRERVLPSRFGELESNAPTMRVVFDRLRRAARGSVNILITGESGSGKGHIARALHEQSPRAKEPFIVVDCAQISPTLIESELFGHEKGAFTGATERRIGAIARAHRGTLFVDEIGDLPLSLQGKLLRVFDEKVFQSLGGKRFEKSDVRIVSATFRNLKEMVNRDLFRTDLLFRLGIPVELPPLHERLEDLEIITGTMLAAFGRPELRGSISRATFDWMRDQPWDGNLRGLRDVIEFAMGEVDGGAKFDLKAAYAEVREMRAEAAKSHGLHIDAAPPLSPIAFDALAREGSSIKDVQDVGDEARRLLFTKLHAECDGIVSEIARRAGVSRPYARKELDRLGLRKAEPPPRWLRRKRAGGAR